MGFSAHTPGISGEWHSLASHLSRVSALAGESGDRIGVGALARATGILHDLGKYHPEFQEYLQSAWASDTKRSQRGFVDHKRTSARLAAQADPDLRYLAFFILGHHGGLQSRGDVRRFLDTAEYEDHAQLVAGIDEVSTLVQQLPCVHEFKREYETLVESKLEEDLFIRMAFSCLVDADAADTAEHFEGSDRTYMQAPGLHECQRRLSHAYAELVAKAPDTLVNRIRADVHRECLDAAKGARGLFRLTVPTGGGKTLASLAFALEHALTHGLDRVIYVVPYTSIIEQTAAVFRGCLGADAVLEHHSSVHERAGGTRSEGDSGTDALAVWQRIAQENWDAPVIVTTSVQFFESLFSSRPGKCRKLHRIAQSVVVLDEAQTLPIHLREPIDDMILSLSRRYGTSFVLCTATQPAFDCASRHVAGDLELREIITEPARHFGAMKRISYQVAHGRWSWRQVAEEMRAVPQCLAIVNSRKDALSLHEALEDPEALHLSTLMCAAHRRAVLEEIRDRLREDSPCRVVSTQVVEAGVDVDFPCVLRAMGPLDSIIQAAGRCNREGTLPEGRVTIFTPEDESIPLGHYRAAIELTLRRLADGSVDLHDPCLFEEYSRELIESVQQDPKKVQERRSKLDFPEVDLRFRIIDDETLSVLVPYDDGVFERLTGEMSKGHLDLASRRLLQQHSVALRRYELDRYHARNLLAECAEGSGLYAWTGTYDPVRGIGEGVEEPSRTVF